MNAHPTTNKLNSIVRRKDMEGDIVQMGAYIGAGLACTGMGGAAVGVGHVVGNFLSGALRNPSAAGCHSERTHIHSCRRDTVIADHHAERRPTSSTSRRQAAFLWKPTLVSGQLAN